MEEIIEKRTRRSKTFDLGNGKFRLETGRYRHTQKNGLWLPIDNTIESENGVDSDTGLQFVARSRQEMHDYSVRFGKNNPAWVKIKHLDSGKKLVFKPKNGNANPDHVVTDNKISVSQVWPGVDMEIFVTDTGIKSNYLITSSAGQRVIELNTSGDLADFRVAKPWYRAADSPVPVTVPTAFASGVLSYDFRNVPVGSVVDPLVSLQPDATAGIETSMNADNPNIVGGADTWPFIGVGQLSGAGPTKVWRPLIKFDLSSITDTTVVVSGATLTVYDSDGTAGAHSYVMNRVKRDWLENYATWNYYKSATYWETAGAGAESDIYLTPLGSCAYFGMSVGTARHFTGFDADIEAMLADQSTNFGWRISGDEGAAGWFQWHSSDYATADKRPMLSFSYEVPAPGGGSSPSPSFNFGGSNYPFAKKGFR